MASIGVRYSTPNRLEPVLFSRTTFYVDELVMREQRQYISFMLDRPGFFSAGARPKAASSNDGQAWPRLVGVLGLQSDLSLSCFPELYFMSMS